MVVSKEIRLRLESRNPGGQSAVRTVDVVDEGKGIFIGRAEGCALPLPLPEISARHACLFQDANGGWRLRDDRSANGTFVLEGAARRLNKGESVAVVPGAEFSIGPMRITFLGPSPDATETAGQPVHKTGTIARQLVADLFAGMRPEEVATLAVKQGPDEGKVLSLWQVDRKYRVGRDNDCDLALLCDDVSRQHTSFCRDWDGVKVTDLQSKNGTLVDGAPIDGPVGLHDGQRIQIGHNVFVVDDPEQRYLKELQAQAAQEELDAAAFESSNPGALPESSDTADKNPEPSVNDGNGNDGPVGVVAASPNGILQTPSWRAVLVRQLPVILGICVLLGLGAGVLWLILSGDPTPLPAGAGE